MIRNTINETTLPFYRILLKSNVLQKEVENIILLPLNYSKDKAYPVLYLLLGSENDTDEWVRTTNLCQYAAEFDMIIATPNNGWQSKESWYVDSDILENSAYETYIIDEFIPFMNSNYSVIHQKNGRAISGISMGGHGALTLASKHTDLFCSVSSYMGIMDLETWKDRNSWLHESLTKVLGDYENNASKWKANSAINLVENLFDKNIKIKFCCGAEDTTENGGGAFPDNEKLHEKLVKINVEHEYFSFHGGHNYEAIDCYIRDFLDFHYRSFKL